MTRPRVMFFATDVARQSGASYAMKETIRRVSRLGAKVTVVVPDSPESRAMFPLEEFDARFLRLVRPRRKASLKLQFSFLARFLPTVADLCRIIRSDEINLVHSNEITDFAGGVAAGLCGVKSVSHVRADGLRPALQWVLVRALDMLADTVIVPSLSTKAWMVEQHRRIERKIAVVRDSAFDLEDYSPGTAGDAFRAEFQVAADESLVVLVSKLTKEKGHLCFIRAAELALKESSKLRFVIVGGVVDGHEDEAEEIRRAADQARAAVALAGQRTDLAACYAAADVVVHCPIYPDTYPTVVLLAMAMGKTVIGSRIGGIPEQIEHGKTGLLVPPNDAQALASAIIDALRDPARRAEIGGRAKAWARAEYAPGAQGAMLMEAYRSVLEMRGTETAALPSNRSFGLLFVAVFGVLGLASEWRGGVTFPYWFALSAATLGIACLAPFLLAPLNRSWMRFGAVLHRVVNPLVIGAVFLAVITPFAIVMRIARRDALRRRFDASAKSYWIPRDPTSPDAESFRDQY